MTELQVAAITLVSAFVYRMFLSPLVVAGAAALASSQARSMRRRVQVGALVLLTVCGGTALMGPGPGPLGPLRWLSGCIVVIVTWQLATTDYDLSLPIRPQAVAKAVLLLLAAAAVAVPWLLLPWMCLAAGRLQGWKHHAMMPLRLVKATLCWLLVVGVAIRVADLSVSADVMTASHVSLLGCVHLSHYLKAGWTKTTRGPHRWTWLRYNRLHYLMASSYLWGWARFLPKSSALAAIRFTARFDVLLGALALVVEFLPAVAFLERRLFVVTLLAIAAFNAAVALAAGVLFWENIVVTVVFAVSVAQVPAAQLIPAMGPLPWLLSLPLLLAGTAGLVWQPWRLGWFDTPFAARIQWEAETTDGRRFGLYNDYMCPYEREYGRIHGQFLTTDPIVTAHLGATNDFEVRNAIVAADGDLDRLVAVKNTYGRSRWDRRLATEHLRYLQAMFGRLNAGAPKGPLRGRWRLLKAPGGQLFYGGDLPRYRGGEVIRRITIRYSEQYYRANLNDFVLVKEEVLHVVDIACPATRA